VDDLRRFGGRILVFICTNRFNALDPAIIRRALAVERFDRPDDSERRQLLMRDLEGTGMSSGAVEELVALTGPTVSNPGYTYSDIRTRLLPAAVSRAFPERRLTDADLLEVAQQMNPTPSIDAYAAGR
jgi:AAA+ superfamily predicted ATPase